MANFSMNDRVEFIAYTQIEDEDGILEDKEEVVYSCWANKKYMTNDEFVNSYATFNKYLISFRVRYCNFTKTLEYKTKEYKLRYKGQVFNIIAAIDYQSLHKFVDVKCEVMV